MRRFLVMAALVGFAPAVFAQSLVVPNQNGTVLATGQTFTIQYTPGADSGAFDFNLQASPASGITITAASGSIPNGTVDCARTATTVTCLAVATVASTDLGAGTISVTYTGGSSTGAVSLAFNGASFFSQTGVAEFGTTSGGTLTLQRLAQAPLAATATPASIVFGGTSALSASGGSGSGAVSFAVTAGASVCAISGSTLTATGVGNCTVTATKAGDASFNPATATATVSVARANQAALAATATPSTVAVGATSALAASGGSGTGALSFAVTAGAGSCTVTGSTLTAIAAGTCTVTATKAADANYNAASATVQVTVPNGLPTISAAATASTLEDLASAPIAITLADAETPAGSLVLAATSSNPAVVTNAALAAGLGGSGANRSLVVTPVANANGSATITLNVADANGGSASRALALTVTAVNDAPSFSVAGTTTTAPGASGAQTRSGFVTGVVLGPADEAASQSVQSYAVTQTSDPDNVVGAITLATNGTLSYTLSGTPGIADFSAVLTDSGGTANGGIASSAPQAFRIVVPLSADLELTLGNGVPNVASGGPVVYQLDVANAGPSAATGARVQLPLPTGLAGSSWTCVPLLLASCPVAAGSGAIDATVNLPSGGALRWTLSGTVSAAAGATLAATATVTAPVGVADPDLLDNSASDSDPVVADAAFDNGFEPVGALSVAVPDALPQD
jgi:uncharacterized repeat protein (TIGR01451 family)